MGPPQLERPPLDSAAGAQAMCPSKQALLDEAKRIGRRALTLSWTMLRCDALADAGGRELTALAKAGAPEYPDREESVAATKQMKNTTFMRAEAYFTFLFAALYPVVEKWLEWGFSDPAVDALLADKDKLRRLEKYRHAVFHADHNDHDDFTVMVKDEDLRSWSARLAVAIRAYLRRWHADPVAHVTQHMESARKRGAV